MSNTPQQNSKICMQEIINLRAETEKDDVEIFAETYGFGTGLLRLSIVITRNSEGKYNFIHYQAVTNKIDDEEVYSYIVDYKLKEVDVEEMMSYCIKYPFRFYAERY